MILLQMLGKLLNYEAKPCILVRSAVYLIDVPGIALYKTAIQDHPGANELNSEKMVP